ncbi:MAG: cell division protein FtsW, partial [bacterium P201]
KSMGEDKESIDPFDDKHMQRTYANIAVASGSLFGKGPGKSEQRNFLPHPYSDFIYAIIIEEYGLLGGIVVLMLYIFLFTRVIRIIGKRPLTFGGLMAFGLGFLIILQAMVNMGVSIGLLPVTGQPLPFVSMGGTSLMATGLILGMILSVTRSMEEEEMTKEQEIEAITEISEEDER